MPRENLNGVTDLSTEITPQDIDSIGNSYAKDFVVGKREKDKVKTNQLRNFYSSIVAIRNKYRIVKEVNSQIERDLILLKPKLAYAAGRQKSIEPFYNLMKIAIDATVSEKVSNKKAAFENLIALTEAIVAYHKFYDPKND